MAKIPSVVVTLIAALLAVITFDLGEYRLALKRMSQELVCYRGIEKVDCPLKPGADWDTFPPPQYDYLFPGPIIITRKANMTELNKVCGGNRVIGACGERRAYSCQIFILADNNELEALGLSYRAVIRHEIGHCNGWPGTHPDRRWEVPDWHDIPPERIFYGAPLAEQLMKLGKRHLKEME